METCYINIFGGPGVGKSTFAAGLFHHLKRKGVECEYVSEVAKDLVWEDRQKTLSIQPYVDAKQYRNLKRLQGKVAYVITDSPVLKGVAYAEIYTDLPPAYTTLLHWMHKDLGISRNLMLKRTDVYSQVGRNETQLQAELVDKELNCLGIYFEVPISAQSVAQSIKASAANG
tara:strand:+ start:200 stop:715 length:516 start_codon:yes stop_codon:yes gene_type:complete